MVAGTVVVHELQEQGDSYWYAQQSSAPTSASVEAISTMTAQEFELIETFLNRRLDLPLNVPPSDRPSPENFLEEISRRYRDTARFR